MLAPTSSLFAQMTITYRFQHEQRQLPEFHIDPEQDSEPKAGQAQWTRLGCHQCPNCPLDSERVSHCPTAVDLEELVTAFNEILSYERVQVTVHANDRSISKACDVQDALSPLMGLIMSRSACPILGRLRGLARIHTPFQTVEEALFRFAGAFFIGQLLRREQGEAPEWGLAGLNALFDELMVLNKAFKSRIQSGAEQDSAMNAISALAMQILNVQISLDDWQTELAPLAIDMSGLDSQPS